MKEIKAYLGLGSNIGDRMAFLRDAVRKLSETEQIEIKEISKVYQTEPVGYVAQEDFYNMVVGITTDLSPMHLLEICRKIEREMGRSDSVHKGPRTIDIDILLYGDSIINEYRLQIPHPRLLDREFVLRPLCDIAPELCVETVGVSIRDALDKIAGNKRVLKLDDVIELGEVV